MVEERDIMKGYISAMFMGKAPSVAQVTFPQSHIIYAGSIREAHQIIQQGGYIVLDSGTVELYKASATPEVGFKIATEGLTPAFSELGSKGKTGCKTFFAKDYRKLRISLGEDGRTTDWILTKEAKKSKDMTSAVAAADDFMVKALSGTVRTSCMPVQNHNYEKEKPAEGWRKERKRERKALKKSPAYIRGSLSTLAKKKKQKEKEGDKVGEEINEKNKVEKVTADKNKEEAATMLKTNMEEVVAKEGGVKCSRYFAFVRNILEKKREKRARQREEQEGITPLRASSSKVNTYDEEHKVIAAQVKPSQFTSTPTLLGGGGGESKTEESPQVRVLPDLEFN